MVEPDRRAGLLGRLPVRGRGVLERRLHRRLRNADRRRHVRDGVRGLDPAPLASVQVSLQQVSTGLWWDGVSFTSASPAYGAALGTTSVALVVPGLGLPGGRRLPRPHEGGRHGRQRADRADSTTFRIDNVNPTSTVGFPAGGGFYNAGAWAAGCGHRRRRHLRHRGRRGRLGSGLRPVEPPPGLDGAVLERLQLLERVPGVHLRRRRSELVGRLRVLQLPGRRQLHAVGTGDGSRGERGGHVDGDVRRRHDRPDLERGAVRHVQPRLVAQPDRDHHGHGQRRLRHPEDRVPARRRPVDRLRRGLRRDR